MMLLKSNLYDICIACCTDTLENVKVEWYDDMNACGLVLVGSSYPDSGLIHKPITGW
jgi:phosphoribosylamine-glycine ligase